MTQCASNNVKMGMFYYKLKILGSKKKTQNTRPHEGDKDQCFI